MHSPSVRWIFLVILLNKLCLTKSRKVIPGLMKVRIETGHKICTTVYAKHQHIFTPKVHKDSKSNQYLNLDTEGHFVSHLKHRKKKDPVSSHQTVPSILHFLENLKPESSKQQKTGTKVNHDPVKKYITWALQKLHNINHSLKPLLVMKQTGCGKIDDIGQLILNLTSYLNDPERGGKIEKDQVIKKILITLEGLDKPDQEHPAANLNPMTNHIDSALQELNEVTHGLSHLVDGQHPTDTKPLSHGINSARSLRTPGLMHHHPININPPHSIMLPNPNPFYHGINSARPPPFAGQMHHPVNIHPPHNAIFPNPNPFYHGMNSARPPPFTGQMHHPVNINPPHNLMLPNPNAFYHGINSARPPPPTGQMHHPANIIPSHNLMFSNPNPFYHGMNSARPPPFAGQMHHSVSIHPPNNVMLPNPDPFYHGANSARPPPFTGQMHHPVNINPPNNAIFPNPNPPYHGMNSAMPPPIAGPMHNPVNIHPPHNEILPNTNQHYHEADSINDRPQPSTGQMHHSVNINPSHNAILSNTNQHYHEIDSVNDRPQPTTGQIYHSVNINPTHNAILSNTNQLYHETHPINDRPLPTTGQVHHSVNIIPSHNAISSNTNQLYQEIASVIDSPQPTTGQMHHSENIQPSHNVISSNTNQLYHEIHSINDSPLPTTGQMQHSINFNPSHDAIISNNNPLDHEIYPGIDRPLQTEEQTHHSVTSYNATHNLIITNTNPLYHEIHSVYDRPQPTTGQMHHSVNIIPSHSAISSNTNTLYHETHPVHDRPQLTTGQMLHSANIIPSQSAISSNTSPLDHEMYPGIDRPLQTIEQSHHSVTSFNATHNLILPNTNTLYHEISQPTTGQVHSVNIIPSHSAISSNVNLLDQEIYSENDRTLQAIEQSHHTVTTINASHNQILSSDHDEHPFDFNSVIDNLREPFENINRIITDLTVLDILQNKEVNTNDGINAQIPLIEEDLSSVLNKTGSLSNETKDSVIVNVYSSLEHMAEILVDLELLQTFENTDSHPSALQEEVENLTTLIESYMVHTPPMTYNVTQLLPVLSNKVPDHDVMSLVQEFTEIKKHYNKFSNKVPPHEQDQTLWTDVEDLSGKIPELTKILESFEQKETFWKQEFENPERKEKEILNTLEEIHQQGNKAAQTPQGFHKISQLICVMLRLLSEDLLDIDLLKYIRYFYWILSTNPNASMKSSDLREQTLKMLPGGKSLMPINIVIDTLKSPLFQDVYWIPEYGGTENIHRTITALKKVFLEGESTAMSLPDIAQIMCVLITLEDTGLINLTQEELDRMIQYLFLILESVNMKDSGPDQQMNMDSVNNIHHLEQINQNINNVSTSQNLPPQNTQQETFNPDSVLEKVIWLLENVYEAELHLEEVKDINKLSPNQTGTEIEGHQESQYQTAAEIDNLETQKTEQPLSSHSPSEDFKEEIPQLITNLESWRLEEVFWKYESNISRVNETLKTLAEIKELGNNAAQTPSGYHRVSQLICVMLRLLKKNLLETLDLMSYIKYFYGILDSNTDASMKSGDLSIRQRKSEILPGGKNLKPVTILIDTIKSPTFEEIYWIPESAGTGKMASTLSTLIEIFIEGQQVNVSLDDLAQIMCILITLEDTGLINLTQVELDRMVKYLFPILENVKREG